VAKPEPKGNGEPRKNGGEKPRKAAEKARRGIGLRQRLREKDPNAKKLQTREIIGLEFAGGVVRTGQSPHHYLNF